MDFKKIEEGVRLVLEGIGEDLRREGLKETPRRVAEMCAEIFSGLNQQPQLEVGFTTEGASDDFILVKNISFYSMCEHHLLPFFGQVHLLYIPQDNRVTGFSSIARVVELYARRLQLQERLTHQIADTFMKALRAKGVLVVVEATHLCLCMRGSRKEAARTITQAIRGDLPMERIHLQHLMG